MKKHRLGWGSFIFLSCVWMLGTSCEGNQPENDSDIYQGRDGLTCQVGDAGCICDAQSQCEEGAACTSGVCQLDDCAQGEEGCACNRFGQCFQGLVCNELKACTMNEAAAGERGGTCLMDGTCDEGYVCNASRICQQCHAGNAGCPCFADQICRDSLICNAQNTCVSESWDEPVPENPVCFSPCKSGFTDQNGQYHLCSVEGLMEGCFDGATCQNGSCTKPFQPSVSCSTDNECADFQVCLRGSCYSNCEIDSDCSGDRICYRHACRTSCSAAEDTCEADKFCLLTDGDQGHCMPLLPPKEGAAKRQVLGQFEISDNFINFSNNQIISTVQIINHSDQPQDFVVRRSEHTQYNAEGSIRVLQNPMPWLAIGEVDAAERVNEFTVRIAGNGASFELQIEVQDVEDGVPAKWEGTLEVENAMMGIQQIRLDYAEKPDGRWAGKVYYFNQFGDKNLEQWVADKSPDNAGRVGNAFIREWSAMRNGGITLDQFDAAMTATVEGSWKWPSVREICLVASCYLYSNAAGYIRYSLDLNDAPIPSGVIALPISIDLKTNENDEASMQGRIVSSDSLHYAGDPQIQVAFEGNPTECEEGELNCRTFLSSLESTVVVGGRYNTTQGDSSCEEVEGDFEQIEVPWILPDFLEGVRTDAETGAHYKYECRDKQQPFGSADSDLEVFNVSLAASNPIPDGKSRVRQMELVDGVLINQTTLLVIFKESFQSFLGGEEASFSAYGLMALEKINAQLDVDTFDGNVQSAEPQQGVDLTFNASCDEDLLREIPGFEAPLAANNASGVLEGLIRGSMPDAREPETYLRTQVHYLCYDTGRFDTGPTVEGNASASHPCPETSRATYFAGDIPDDLSGLPCQQDGTCEQALRLWVTDPNVDIEFLDGFWRCSQKVDPRQCEQIGNEQNGFCNEREEYRVYCDTDRHDLRIEKVFFKPNQEIPPPAFVPLRAEIQNAFRYKTRFRNRQGTNIGFVPEVCVPNSNTVPYCYDPSAIEKIQKRVNCAVHIFSEFYDNLDDSAKSLGKSYLDSNFSYDEERRFGLDPLTHDGFEHLNAELSIMLGDEAYAAAFRSRFDLAGISIRSFEGAKFEPNGINLSGVAGYEMYNLYKATQYYRLVLDRFYGLSPWVWQAINHPQNLQEARNFISQRSVTTYLNKLLRASTQLSRSWSEIAKRYQNFNRPDLARFVIERAYTSAYLESVVISRLLEQIVSVEIGANRDQIIFEMDKAANRYRAALLEMRTVYGSITDEINYFGFSADYIPMPALAPNGGNSFEALLATARQSIQIAAAKEDLAIHSNRAFETDAASFQAELARISNTYEAQLGDVCGTFQGPDRNIYPAIPKYAYLDDRAKLLGDPCGLMGNGQLSEAIGQVEIVEVEIQALLESINQLLQSVTIEKSRAEALCEETISFGDIEYQVRGETNNLRDSIRNTNQVIEGLKTSLSIASELSHLASCVVGLSTDCPTKMAAYAAYSLVSTAIEGASFRASVKINNLESEIDDIERGLIKIRAQSNCNQIKINSESQIKGELLKLKSLELEGLKLSYSLKLALSRISKLRDEATRQMAEQEEVEQLSINVEAAKNDPNVRIYKNDAIINAERTFYNAIRNTYRLAKVFEYYTSQSYEPIANLSLIRMVSRGDYNLENFVQSIEESYYNFNESFGRPDLRVDILSVRDDFLGIPRIDEGGQALSLARRVELFREALTNPRMLNVHGYLSLPFSTSFSRLSPLTRNHKIAYLEVELVGSDVGDTLGRVYLTQGGTGVVRSVDNSKSYFRFPERTAVINPIFNGVRLFTPDVYRNDRLRDLPVVNTSWDFLLNQRDEFVNQDIDLNSLNDIRVFVYYTDFTAL